MKRTLATVVMLIGVAAGQQSSAQTSGESRQQADRHMARGVELRSQGRDEDALPELQRSYDLNPDPRAAAQLGLVHQALGHWLDAEARLREALASDSDAWVRRNRRTLDTAHSVALQRIGVLTLSGAPAGAEVVLNGRSVGTLPLREPLRTLAGTVTLELRAPGYYPEVRRVTVQAGEQGREHVVLQRTPEEHVVRRGAQPVRSGPRWLVPVGWIGVGVGAAGLLVGGVSTGVAVQARDELMRSPCNPMPLREPATCAEATRRSGTAIPLMTAGYVVGGVLVAAGITALVIDRVRSSEGRAALSCEPAMGGGACRWTF